MDTKKCIKKVVLVLLIIALVLLSAVLYTQTSVKSATNKFKEPMKQSKEITQESDKKQKLSPGTPITENIYEIEGLRLDEVDDTGRIHYTNTLDKPILLEVKKVDSLEQNKYLFTPGFSGVVTFPYGIGEYKLTTNSLTKRNNKIVGVKLDKTRISVTQKIDSLFTGDSFYCDYTKYEDQVKQISDTIINEGMTLEEKAKAIFDYVIANYTYDETLANERNRLTTVDIAEIIKSKTGVCLDFTVIQVALLRYNNIESKVCLGYYDSKENHAWAEVKLEDSWFIYDVTLKSIVSSSDTNMYSITQYS